MNQYLIKYKRNDMPKGYVGSTTKWARDEKTALRFLLARNEKNGVAIFKRGGSGKILSVEVLNNDKC